MVKLSETAIFKKIRDKFWAVEHMPYPLAILLQVIVSAFIITFIWKPLWWVIVHLLPLASIIPTLYMNWFFNTICCFIISINSTIFIASYCFIGDEEDRVDFLLKTDDGKFTYCGQPIMVPLIYRLLVLFCICIFFGRPYLYLNGPDLVEFFTFNFTSAGIISTLLQSLLFFFIVEGLVYYKAGRPLMNLLLDLSAYIFWKGIYMDSEEDQSGVINSEENINQ